MIVSGQPWHLVPAISGRLATEDDVKAGRAVFVLADSTAKAYPIALPCCARLAEREGARTPVIVIQAESTERGVFFGFRELTGETGVCLLDELELLPGPDASFEAASAAAGSPPPPSLATPALAEAIRTLLLDRHTLAAHERRLADRFQALPIGPDLWSEVFLRPDGEILRVEKGVPERRSREESDLLLVLVLAAARYPSLARFIPERPPGATDCSFCSGERVSACPGCLGLGWVR